MKIAMYDISFQLTFWNLLDQLKELSVHSQIAPHELDSHGSGLGFREKVISSTSLYFSLRALVSLETKAN